MRLGAVLVPATLMAAPVFAQAPPSPSYLERYLDADIAYFSYFQVQTPAENDRNPRNQVYRIDDYEFKNELRPTLSLKDPERDFQLSIKPRLIATKRRIDEPIEGDRWLNRTELIANEYLVQKNGVFNDWSVSAYRGPNLWGPAYVESPSNPFSTKAATVNPLLELRGIDFFRLTFAPSMAYSLDYFYNYGKGERDYLAEPSFIGKFKKIHAVKLDLYNDDTSFSFVVSDRADDRIKGGAYGQWTVSEATLLYFDGAVTRGSEAFYPQRADLAPAGGFYAQSKDNSNTLFPEIVLGGAYTTLSNYTFNFEYLYYGPGYSEEQLDLARKINRRAAQLIDSQNSDMTAILGSAFNNGLRSRGRHVAVQQMTRSYTIGDDIVDLTIQNQFNMQDGSGSLYGELSYALGRHRFAVSGLGNYGAPNDLSRDSLLYAFGFGYQYRL